VDGRKQYTKENAIHKKRENDQEKDPEPDGWTKLEMDIK
jgi:hypothetical protein